MISQTQGGDRTSQLCCLGLGLSRTARCDAHSTYEIAKA
jgi:hypothetical protein